MNLLSYTHDLLKIDYNKRDQKKKNGLLKISPTSPTNLPDEKMNTAIYTAVQSRTVEQEQ